MLPRGAYRSIRLRARTLAPRRLQSQLIQWLQLLQCRPRDHLKSDKVRRRRFRTRVGDILCQDRGTHRCGEARIHQKPCCLFHEFLESRSGNNRCRLVRPLPFLPTRGTATDTVFLIGEGGRSPYAVFCNGDRLFLKKSLWPRAHLSPPKLQASQYGQG